MPKGPEGQKRPGDVIGAADVSINTVTKLLIDAGETCGPR
jgi:hypothetical protein